MNMYGFVSGISDTDDINYCPKCGGEKLSLHGDGTAVCLDCGIAFAVVKCEEVTRNDPNKFQSIYLRTAERQVRREQEKETED